MQVLLTKGILNSQYIYSSTIQFLSDLQNCIPDVIESTFASVHESSDNIEKIVAIFVLPKYQTEYSHMFNELTSFPLLQYRIHQYSTLFSNRAELKEYLTAHRKRISWHLMRIYRNHVG